MSFLFISSCLLTASFRPRRTVESLPFPRSYRLITLSFSTGDHPTKGFDLIISCPFWTLRKSAIHRRTGVTYKLTMRIILFKLLTLLLFLSACASQDAVDAPTPAIDASAPEFEDRIFYAARLPEMTNILESTNLEVREAPKDWRFSSCGGVYSDEDLIRERLKNAEVIFRFSGVKEEWIPIEGKPNEYFIFSLQ